MNTTMSQIDMELIELFRSMDDSGKEMMLNAVICCVAFGDEFMKDWQSAIDSGNRDEMMGTLKKWRAKVEG